MPRSVLNASQLRNPYMLRGPAARRYEANAYMLMTCCVAGSAAATQQVINMYAFASYLLAAGPRSMYGFLSWDAFRTDLGMAWWPGYGAQIGQPLGPYSQRADGLYQRLYSRGLVLANAGPVPVTLSLPRPIVLLL